MADDPLDKAFAALSDPVRRAIVARLSRGPATVKELAEPFEITLQAVSKHIGVLESAGIECFLLGENTNSLLGAAFFAQLQVHRKDEAAALEILGSSEGELNADEDVKMDEGADGKD